MNRRTWLSLALAVLAVVACDGGGGPDNFSFRRRVHPTPTSSDSRVIGFVGTMSGPEAWRGEDAFEGADVAVQVINRKQRGTEAPFELVTLDDEGDPERATALVRELAGSERTAGIVYAGPPEGLPPAEGALADAGIPALLCFGDLYGARKLSAHVFQVSPSYVWQARRLARYALQDRGYETVGALVEDSLDGGTAVSVLRTELARAGGRLEVALRYPTATAGFFAPLDRLRSKGVEALVVQGQPQALGRIVAELGDMEATYRNTDRARVASRPKKARKKAGRSRSWAPQLLSFDAAISPLVDEEPPAGTVAADSYARGVSYLPVPSFERYEKSFVEWWGAQPTGWELRGFEATRMIAHAASRTAEGDDVAHSLETLEGARFGGLDITVGPDDHTSVGASTVGLWVVPGAAATVVEREELPEGLPWVPLARGFSIDGDTTDILARDWKFLFRDPPPPTAPAPKVERMRFGVTTPRSDPLH